MKKARNFETQGKVDVRDFAALALDMYLDPEYSKINKSNITAEAFRRTASGLNRPETVSEALDILQVVGVTKISIGRRGKQAIIDSLIEEDSTNV